MTTSPVKLESNTNKPLFKIPDIIFSTTGIKDFIEAGNTLYKKEYVKGICKLTTGAIKASITILAVMKAYDLVFPTQPNGIYSLKDGQTFNLLDPFAENAKRTVCSEHNLSLGKDCNPKATCQLVSSFLKNGLSNYVDCEVTGFPTNRFGVYLTTPIAIGRYITNSLEEIELEELTPPIQQMTNDKTSQIFSHFDFIRNLFWSPSQ